MVVVKILKRKDASSIIVALVLAGIFSMFLMVMGSHFSQIFSSNDFGGTGWQDAYLVPTASMLAQLILFEVGTRVFIAAREGYLRRK